jgi:hypothetical protein
MRRTPELDYVLIDSMMMHAASSMYGWLVGWLVGWLGPEFHGMFVYCSPDLDGMFHGMFVF